MFNLNSINKNISLKLKLLKRSKKYKKLNTTLNNQYNILVKVLYKVNDTVLMYYINIKKNISLQSKKVLNHYRFYDSKVTKLFKDIFKLIKDKEIDKTLYEYLTVIYTYGILLNVGVSYFGLPITFMNITIFGIWFYFIKEELYPMILKILRGVDA